MKAIPGNGWTTEEVAEAIVFTAATIAIKTIWIGRTPLGRTTSSVIDFPSYFLIQQLFTYQRIIFNAFAKLV